MKHKTLSPGSFSFSIIYFFIAFLVFLSTEEPAFSQEKKPNIILILVDDIGYKALSCNGGNLYSTPNLDTLAQKGLRFTQCHAAPSCTPSRFMLLTGKYNFRNYTQWGIMDRDQKTLGNMFKDAGYKTACFGKWQLDGGDLSIKTFGFDKYLVHDALDLTQMGSRYKNPNLYTNGAFLPAEDVKDKYGPDIVMDSLFRFIDSNKNNPFFIYYPMLLCHTPFQPTPYDADFFNDRHSQNNPAYFPSMMKYMDGELGKLIAKLKNTGIDSNTLIIYVGDNGTPTEVYDHDEIKGGKGSTKEIGTHVPLIAYWPGIIEENSINNDLIDLTDFLPTLAGVSDIPAPTSYGILDGVSFFPALMNKRGTPRDWIFYHYDPNRGESSLIRWAQTKSYKLYDTSAENNTLLFYDIVNDPQENNPIPDGLLTPEQTIIKQQLLEVINSYASQGARILNTPKLASATDTSAKVANSIITDGTSTITASGVVWSIDHNPVLNSGAHTSDNIPDGSFYSVINGLRPMTTYFLRTYAINITDTAYSEEISFTTKTMAPICLPATEITDTGFSANWNTINGIANYAVDVSISSTFSFSQSSIATEGFDEGNKLPDGWFLDQGFNLDTINYGKSSPSKKISIKKQRQIITPEYKENATRLSFWLKGAKDNAGTLLVQGFDGLVWLNIDYISYIPRNPQTKVYDSAFFSSFKTNFKQFKFIFNKTNGDILFDDVEVKYIKTISSFVSGYHNSAGQDNSLNITGLKTNTKYYYRIRGVSTALDDTSAYSNVIEVIPCEIPLINAITAINPDYFNSTSGYIDLDVTGDSLTYAWTGPANFTAASKEIRNLSAGTYRVTIASASCSTDTSVILTRLSNEDKKLAANVFPSPSAEEFTLTIETNSTEPINIVVSDLRGRAVYMSDKTTNGRYKFGRNFVPGVYFTHIFQGSTKKTIKIIKSGY